MRWDWTAMFRWWLAALLSSPALLWQSVTPVPCHRAAGMCITTPAKAAGISQAPGHYLSLNSQSVNRIPLLAVSVNRPLHSKSSVKSSCPEVQGLGGNGSGWEYVSSKAGLTLDVDRNCPSSRTFHLDLTQKITLPWNFHQKNRGRE